MKFSFLLYISVLAGESLAVFKVASNVLFHISHLDKNSLPEDATLTVPEIIAKYGYPIEIYTVTTSDGYVLEIHRIPHGKNGSTGNEKPVLLQHGIIGSSADFIIPGPDHGLGYILADNGYDVWLPNSRGNRYSRKHTSLDPDKNAKEFWDFSWHEIAIHDLPAIIDHIIEQTKEPKMYYIGHSQGTTIFYVLCSEKPEYNDKITVMFGLAPIAYMSHMTSPILRKISYIQSAIKAAFKIIGMHEFLPHSSLLSMVAGTLCGEESVFQALCSNSLFAVVGFNRKQLNVSLIPIISGHLPAGVSTKQVLHFGQLHKSGKFSQYDMGIFKNLQYYGKWNSPEYNLRKVKVPVYLYYSKNDWMSNEEDVQKLCEELGNLKSKFLVCDKKFNHMDYLFAINASTIIYKKIINLMKSH